MSKDSAGGSTHNSTDSKQEQFYIKMLKSGASEEEKLKTEILLRQAVVNNQFKIPFEKTTPYP